MEGPDPAPAKLSGSERRRRAAVVVVTVVLLLAAAVVFDAVTASPRFCGSCHSMEAREASWSVSPHVVVSCVTCHEEPRPWYAKPVTLYERGALLARDVRWELGGRSRTATGGAGAPSHEVEDVVCLQCHDSNRRATSGFRIRIEHAEHAERNGSCLSCHIDTAHPHGVSVPISLMERCFNCHGTAEQPKASAECGVCHPSGYEVLPQSHKDAVWQERHGAIALAEPQQCDMCHTKESCTDCHGLEMPHPDTWARGQKGHASIAQRERATCARCHTEKPDLCSMCHHKSYDPSKGDWIKQHFIEVRRKGTTYCFECHSPVYCVQCHVR